MSTIHNPSNFEPSDYEVIGYYDNQRPVYCGERVEDYANFVRGWEGELEQAFGKDWRSKIHHCAHCGNGSVRWITAVEHRPTQEVVVFGAICTHRLGFKDRFAFKLAQLQAAAEARKVRFTIYTKRQEFLAAHPEIAEALEAIKRPEHEKNGFVADVLRKLDQYGDLSDRQVAAVVASLARDREFAARKAAEATEVKGDAPTGRQTVTGTILSIKEYPGYTYGSVEYKALVKLENNSRVFVTVPRASDWNRGDTIRFTATFTPKETDKSFAIGKRPIALGKVGEAVVELTRVAS